MSLYSEYLLERTDDRILEDEYGFVTYRYLNENQVYIIDIYVIPEHREQKYASLLADRVVIEAKKRGCTELLGTVVPSTRNATVSMKVLFGYGMKIHSAGNDLIVCKKEI